MQTKLIGVKEFRQNISTFYKKAQKNNLRYIILRRNQPIFKVEPIKKQDLTIEKLSQDIKKARKEIKNGEIYDFEKICADLGI